MNKTRSIVVGLCLTVATVIVATGLLPVVGGSPAPQQQLEENVSAFLADSAERGATEEAVRQAMMNIAFRGWERESAGIHLVKPHETGEAGAYTIYDAGSIPFARINVAYPQLDYSDSRPSGITVDEPNFLSASVSVFRHISNQLARFHVASDPSGLYEVRATFSGRVGVALSRLVANRREYGVSGDYVDWYGRERTALEQATPMTCVLVSDNFAYLPFSIQDLVAHGDQGATIALAKDLTQTEANQMLTKLTR